MEDKPVNKFLVADLFGGRHMVEANEVERDTKDWNTVLFMWRGNVMASFLKPAFVIRNPDTAAYALPLLPSTK